MIRWQATLFYRHEDGTRTEDHDLKEIKDLHKVVEGGGHFDTIEGIFVKRINHVNSPTLTVEQAAEL